MDIPEGFPQKRNRNRLPTHFAPLFCEEKLSFQQNLFQVFKMPQTNTDRGFFCVSHPFKAGQNKSEPSKHRHIGNAFCCSAEIEVECNLPVKFLGETMGTCYASCLVGNYTPLKTYMEHEHGIKMTF